MRRFLAQQSIKHKAPTADWKSIFFIDEAVQQCHLHYIKFTQKIAELVQGKLSKEWRVNFLE